MNLIDRIKKILISPVSEWNVISSEEGSARAAITGYAVPLLALSAACTFIGIGIIGYNIPFFGTVRSIPWGFGQALATFITGILSVVIAGYVIDLLAPNFQSEKNIDRSIRLVVFAFTPSWICGIFNIFPVLGLLSIVGGIYGLVLLWMGLPLMKKTPEDQKVIYYIVSLLVIIACYIILGLIIGAIMAVFIANPAAAGIKDALESLK